MATDTLPLMPTGADTPLQGTQAMVALLRQWRDAGWVRALDTAFAEFLVRQRPDADPLVLLAGTLASHQSGRGHLLLDLEEALRNPGGAVAQVDLAPSDTQPASSPDDLMGCVELEAWRSALAQSDLVSVDGSERRPLVLRDNELYLHRYWRYERDITHAIEGMLAQARDIDEARMAELLEALFPATPGGASPDWQKLACAIAARTHFSVITGGPGTGKTTTVVKLLALLQALALAPGDTPPLRIRLAAPTGKAAARLNESIAAQVSSLALDGIPNADAVRAAVPTEVTTLHRLLGARPDTRKFRHHRLNPLPAEIVVVDEGSMIDVEMMVSLLDALPAHAALILLGDKDQLASVEAGAILGSLCAQAVEGHYTPETQDWLERVAGTGPEPELVCLPARPVDQSIAMLRHSYRFGADSGIGRLARAINTNQPGEVSKILADTSRQDLHRLSLAEIGDDALEALVVSGVPGRGHGYAHYLEMLEQERPEDTASKEEFDGWAAKVIVAHSQFQLLCSLRRGPAGVEGLTPRIEAALVASGHLPQDAGGAHWYEGRPVLVTGNDYSLKLMNGDIGITMRVPVNETTGEMGVRVAFPAGDGSGGIRWVLPSRLQRIETVFAMTVHKSQGSEFAHAALVMPDAPNPIATRELFYTAVTRAKQLFTLVETRPDITQQVVRSRTQRASRLFSLG